jgi:hypothetical protein
VNKEDEIQMNTDIGEYIVGAHLQLVKDCDFDDYNVRRPIEGLVELYD